MKTLLTLPLLLLSLISFPSWSVTMDDLVERDGIYYKKFSDVPFTGEVEGVSGKTKGSAGGRFKNGKREGLWILYHHNGQLHNKGAYKNGKREGSWVSYWSNGQLDYKGDYKNGKRDGPWVNYHDDEQLRSKGEYKNGKKEGFWIYYWENGQLHQKGEYKNGKKEGRWISYTPFGSPRPGFDGIYRDGVWISD